MFSSTLKRPEPPPCDNNERKDTNSSYLYSNRSGGKDGGGGGASSSFPKNSPKLYIPSIYSYTCRGKFAASSLSLSDQKGSGGSCRGFKSQLEILEAEQQLQMTRVQALERFTTLASDVDMYDYHEENGINHQHSSSENTNELHQRTRTVLLSPALIFKLDVGQSESDDDDTVLPTTGSTNAKNSGCTTNAQSEQLLEEELIVRQDWTCYGSTEVEYMVLQDVSTGDKHICAVAPRNTGVSVREIETSDSVRTLTRFGLGWLDIIHDSNALLVDDDDDEDKTSLDQQQQKQSASLHPQPEEVPSRPSEANIALAKQSALRVYDFSKQVADHMQWNAQWFVNNISDDFPQRTYTAGQNIVQYLPKTIELTMNAMDTIVRQWLGSDEDDDE